MSGGSLLNKGLPYDAEIEYLESDGNAYIDTNIKLSSSHIVDVTFTYIKNQRLIGARSNTFTSFGVYYNYIDLNDIQSNIDKGRLVCSLVVGNLYKAHVENGNRYFSDDTDTIIATNTWISPTFASTKYNTPIFGLRWNSSSVTPAVGRIHKLVIKLNGNLLVDFIPVRIGNVGYMYDRVSKQLFGNAGTGKFILGNDI